MFEQFLSREAKLTAPALNLKKRGGGTGSETGKRRKTVEPDNI
jgi:hypothetical protein